MKMNYKKTDMPINMAFYSDKARQLVDAVTKYARLLPAGVRARVFFEGAGQKLAFCLLYEKEKLFYMTLDDAIAGERKNALGTVHRLGLTPGESIDARRFALGGLDYLAALLMVSVSLQVAYRKGGDCRRVKVQAYFDGELIERLDAEANRLHVPRTEVIRRLVAGLPPVAG